MKKEIKTKYVIILGDGIPDYPLKALDGKTPLAAANTPNLDYVAQNGLMGLVRVIPPGFSPGSDVGHLSILGYDPKRYYTGRAPIEAASMKIPMGPGDIAFRCNLVRLGRKNNQTIMEDYAAGHIPTKKAASIIDMLNKKLGSNEIRFYPGNSYRHIMVWKNGHNGCRLIPPHDLTDKPVASYMPRGEGGTFLRSLMEQSQDLLKNTGTMANAIWLWGAGRDASLPPFPMKGGMVSAVDLVKGIGILSGLDIIKVPGITGYFDTNYKGKVDYALRYLKKRDFVFVHVEAIDEAGHMGDAAKKVQAIEDFDQKVVGPLMKGLKKNFKSYRVLVTSDHATPTILKTHTPDPTVYAIYNSDAERKRPARYKFNEKDARASKHFIPIGHQLIEMFLKT